MIQWLQTGFVVGFALMLAIFLYLIVRRLCRRRLNFKVGIAGTNSAGDNSWKTNLSPSFFSWEDHPTLVKEASEYGWPRFAFRSSASLRPARHFLGGGAGARAGDNGNCITADVGWELNDADASADYMQRVRLNPGMKKTFPGQNPLAGGMSVIRAALPLPGPKLGDSDFPEEAYFEIRVLPGKEDGGEEYENEKLDEDKTKNEEVVVAVGLTGGELLQLKIPGRYPGSVGFDSSGSVHLDGNKLVPSQKTQWRRPDLVIGCGYIPAQQRVFFTVDSQLVHEIHCNSQDFRHPLYPTLASTADTAVVINLGQAPFRYTPGNRYRIPHPLLLRQPMKSASIGSEDLFSIDRSDSQWRQLSAVRINSNAAKGIKSADFDRESEGDLFEVVLDFGAIAAQSKQY